MVNNWRKHAEDRGAPRRWLVDPFSTGCLFPDWKELANQDVMWRLPQGYEPLVVYRPRSWLLATGWKLVGEISAREVPGR